MQLRALRLRRTLALPSGFSRLEICKCSLSQASQCGFNRGLNRVYLRFTRPSQARAKLSFATALPRGCAGLAYLGSSNSTNQDLMSNPKYSKCCRLKKSCRQCWITSKLVAPKAQWRTYFCKAASAFICSRRMELLLCRHQVEVRTRVQAI